MLSSYVNEYQTDWDEYLSFMMMTCWVVEHETTWFSPNYLMFGREKSTSIDLMYEMPTSIKMERMETARFVKQKAHEAKQRQKSLHNHKLN